MGLMARSIASVIIIVIIIQISVCFCNVIGEALVVEESQKNAHNHEDASKYVTLFFGVKSVGTVLTAYSGGILLEYIDKRTIFMITAFCPLIQVIAALILEEANVTETPKVFSQFLEIFKFVSRKDIYIPVIFIFLFTATPSCSDAMFFFYTNNLDFNPEFMGRMKMAYGLANILGMVLYNNFFQAIAFKTFLIASTIACSIISLSQLLLVTNTNSYLGIPDEVFAIFCTFIVQVIGELNMLPLLVLCCRICPKNIEGSLYAMLMSTMNFGGMLSSQAGGILMLLLGITQTDFQYLWILILITSIFMILPLPMLALVPSFHKEEDKKGYELV